MTEPSDTGRPARGLAIFRGRSLGPLLGPWLSSAIFAAILWRLEKVMPALHDVFGPVYWLLLAIVLITTWRWFRVRSRDRREADRRKSDRNPD
jgi:hypothetical protein